MTPLLFTTTSSESESESEDATHRAEAETGMLSPLLSSKCAANTACWCSEGAVEWILDSLLATTSWDFLYVGNGEADTLSLRVLATVMRIVDVTGCPSYLCVGVPQPPQLASIIATVYNPNTHTDSGVTITYETATSTSPVFPSVLVTTEPSPSTVISLGSETSYLTRPLLAKPVTVRSVYFNATRMRAADVIDEPCSDETSPPQTRTFVFTVAIRAVAVGGTTSKPTGVACRGEIVEWG